MGQILSFKAWMVANNIRQNEIAELLDISLQSVNLKVNGKQDFTLPQVKKICERYGISADIFLPEELRYSNIK
jgi:putative transcriptional regulator